MNYYAKVYILVRVGSCSIGHLFVTNLKVSSHDLSGLLVQSLFVPVRIEFGQSSYQTVVFTHQQCV